MPDFGGAKSPLGTANAVSLLLDLIPYDPCERYECPGSGDPGIVVDGGAIGRVGIHFSRARRFA